MNLNRLLSLLSALLLTSAGSAYGGERLQAGVTCTPTDSALVYDCVIVLTGKKTGAPIIDAEFSVGADMPSMPMAHNVKPSSATPGAQAGYYEARIELQMHGEWALKLDISGPTRDKIIVKKHFGESEVK